MNRSMLISFCDQLKEYYFTSHIFLNPDLSRQKFIKAQFAKRFVLSLHRKSQFDMFTLKRYRGGSRQKFSISFVLTYFMALSFFFSKLGHSFLNYRHFWFYLHLSEEGIVKYSKRCTLLKKHQFSHKTWWI